MGNEAREKIPLDFSVNGRGDLRTIRGKGMVSRGAP